MKSMSGVTVPISVSALGSGSVSACVLQFGFWLAWSFVMMLVGLHTQLMRFDYPIGIDRKDIVPIDAWHARRQVIRIANVILAVVAGLLLSFVGVVADGGAADAAGQ